MLYVRLVPLVQRYLERFGKDVRVLLRRGDSANCYFSLLKDVVEVVIADFYALASACGPHAFRHLGRGGVVDVQDGAGACDPCFGYHFLQPSWLRHDVVSVAASAAAIYSASHVLFATTGCCFASHCTGAPLTMVSISVMDFLVVLSFA